MGMGSAGVARARANKVGHLVQDAVSCIAQKEHLGEIVALQRRSFGGGPFWFPPVEGGRPTGAANYDRKGQTN